MEKFETCKTCKWKNNDFVYCPQCNDGNYYEESDYFYKKRKKQKQQDRLKKLKTVPKYSNGQEVFFLEYGDLVMKSTIRGLDIKENGTYEYLVKKKIFSIKEEDLYSTEQEARIALIKNYAKSFLAKMSYETKRLQTLGVPEEEISLLLNNNIKSIELK